MSSELFRTVSMMIKWTVSLRLSDSFPARNWGMKDVHNNGRPTVLPAPADPLLVAQYRVRRLTGLAVRSLSEKT